MSRLNLLQQPGRLGVVRCQREALLGPEQCLGQHLLLAVRRREVREDAEVFEGLRDLAKLVECQVDVPAGEGRVVVVHARLGEERPTVLGVHLERPLDGFARLRSLRHAFDHAANLERQELAAHAQSVGVIGVRPGRTARLPRGPLGPFVELDVAQRCGHAFRVVPVEEALDDQDVEVPQGHEVIVAPERSGRSAPGLELLELRHHRVGVVALEGREDRATEVVGGRQRGGHGVGVEGLARAARVLGRNRQSERSGESRGQESLLRVHGFNPRCWTSTAHCKHVTVPRAFLFVNRSSVHTARLQPRHLHPAHALTERSFVPRAHFLGATLTAT